MKDAPPVQQQTAANQPDVKSLGEGRFSIEGLELEQPQPEAQSASNEDEKTEEDPQPDNFQQRAAQVEKDIAAETKDVQDNLSLWKKVYQTDDKFTKTFTNNGGGTSINGIWMVMQATKHLGPQGINWKVEILEERYEKGAPILRMVQDDIEAAIAKFPGISDVTAHHNFKKEIDVYFRFPGGTERASWTLGGDFVGTGQADGEPFKVYLASIRQGAAL